MPLRACPKCQHCFYQIMEQPVKTKGMKEQYVLCSSCGSFLGKFTEGDSFVH